MDAFIRFLLLLAVLVIAAMLVLAHGFRGLAVVMALAVAVTVTQTRGWKLGERWLVGLTGSRLRAAAVALLVVMGALFAVSLVSYLR